VAGKRKAFMDQVLGQVARFAEGVRQEGGVRRTVLEFPDHPVVLVVMRKEEYESIGEPDSGKGPHSYKEQMMVMPLCSWCNQPANHPSHAALLKYVDFPNG